MTYESRATALAAALGADFKSSQADRGFLLRLERETDELLRWQNSRMEAAVAEAACFTEPWLDTRKWTGSGTLVSGRMYSSTGLTRALPTSTRWVARAQLHCTGASGKYAYFGIGDGTNTLGVGQTSSGATAFVNRSAGISAGAVIIPRTMPALPVGDYLVTISKDESYYSMTIQPAASAGQAIYGCRVKISDLPLPPTILFLSANDTVAGGLNWGPVVIYEELAVPPLAKRAVAGVNLFGTGRPLAHWFADPSTSIGRMLHIPGDNDARIPAPLTGFLHQSLSGLASSIYTESRFANVLSSLEAAGYMVVASDNGPSATAAGGTQDKYGNQAGLDDYASMIKWVRTHQNTSGLYLIAPSMGNFFAMNLLQQRIVGGITAVAGISTGYDLVAGLSNPTYHDLLIAAYSASSDADFITKTLLYDPARTPAWRFRGVPWRFYAGDSDTTAPIANTQAFANLILPYSPEATVVTSAGAGHLADALYQGSDIVAFFNKYNSFDDGALPVTGPNERRLLKNQPVTVLQSGTDYVEKFEIVNDGTSSSGWPNRWEMYCTPVGGGAPRLVQYHNEYGERRLNARQNTVLWRAFAREFSSDAAHDVTVPIWEIQNDRDNRVQLHGFFSDGKWYHSGDGTVGGNLAVTGTISGSNIGPQFKAVYNAGAEPAGQPTGTLILVRP